MAIGTIIIGTLVIGGGMTAGALLSRTFLGLNKDIELDVSDDEIEIIELYDPRDHIDIETAMPTRERFPMGWDLREEGKDEHLGDGPQYAASWRTLELKVSEPDGNRWVGVMSMDSRIAPAADSNHIHGFFTAPSQSMIDQAKEETLDRARKVIDIPTHT